MDDKTMMQIVEAVVRELQASNPGLGMTAPINKEGFDQMLVIGDLSDVPVKDQEACRCFDIEDYKTHQNIYRYQKVLITKLSLAQLADIAQGRDGSPESCAVIHALLAGVEVCMLEAALTYRKFAGKSSSRLYQVIENNAKTIQTYGVKLLKPARIDLTKPATPPKYQAPKLQVPRGSAMPSTDRLITEDVAKAMTMSGEKTVLIAGNAIVTPSAWDYFKNKGIEVVKQ